MDQKIRVAVLFGGKSGEHAVSLQSAASVIQAMDPEKMDVFPVLINPEGKWQPGEYALPALEGKMEPKLLEELGKRSTARDPLPVTTSLPVLKWEEIDVVFPVLHGTFGEDGTIQGMLEIADIPYVGAGVLASAVGMDKVMMKKIFAQEGLPQGDFTFCLRRAIEQDIDTVISGIEAEFAYPCFVKPANLGSSVGISKAKNREELKGALQLAARYDRKVIVEEFIDAREVEVAVLGNEEPVASVPGEIVSSNDFYDYRAKYIDGKSEMRIPADLPEPVLEEISGLALKAYQGIDCSGLARVDFFIRKSDGKILINEINTMPGFTPFSMYANLWKHSGISYPELISRLIDLALERHGEKKKSITTFDVE
ncbi:D-alanine--D-alanine ligase [Kroppenstedtia eburnea]|uniref:D-alanine--D-alanine ligase n=1 Tax=Kroppenstedtia eburnea TaxID=714067 RepID=A0A1N7M233_9BACL|nr:D-alanine--D-alanine ligase [Kroppenstedtia eburnea]EGK14802.1 D-alanine-D-alanine ligase [Desmospora sp. 8437]QKI81778.1 D-alanine--D-alanine ligase [Kroppenstedtia eburnea]SIS79991.1 D-alanine-D-alanine ligase [Kroppenstedtia eburnea]